MSEQQVQIGQRRSTNRQSKHRTLIPGRTITIEAIADGFVGYRYEGIPGLFSARMNTVEDDSCLISPAPEPKVEAFDWSKVAVDGRGDPAVCLMCGGPKERFACIPCYHNHREEAVRRIRQWDANRIAKQPAPVDPETKLTPDGTHAIVGLSGWLPKPAPVEPAKAKAPMGVFPPFKPRERTSHQFDRYCIHPVTKIELCVACGRDGADPEPCAPMPGWREAMERRLSGPTAATPTSPRLAPANARVMGSLGQTASPTVRPLRWR